MNLKKNLLLIVIALVPITSLFPVNVVGIESTGTGPFIEKIIYKVIEGDDQQKNALINDQIDLIGDMVDPSHLPDLEIVQNANVVNIKRNGYAYFSINCMKYPLNLTALRRAFAFALDKIEGCDDAWDGLAAPQDSPLASPNPMTVEGEMPYNYYDSNVVQGNSLLDAAGFEVSIYTGFRQAPDGSDFNITIEVADSSNVALDWGNLALSALNSLNINVIFLPTDYYDYLNRVYFHEDYDIVFLGKSFQNFNPSFLVTDFCSDYYLVNYNNYANWQNATFDSWIPQMLTSTTYDEVYDAVQEMQKIIIYECPHIYLYDNFLLSAYRTDRFEGQVVSHPYGVQTMWTNLKTRLKIPNGGPFGGTFRISIPLEVDTFNFMLTRYSYTKQVLENTEISLFRQGPLGECIPWLAESYTIEKHDDNASIPLGHTRYTLNLIQNATWSDGNPLTAEDVAYSLNYYIDSMAYGNEYGEELTNLTSAFTPSSYSLVVEFETESYWNFEKFAFLNIIPKHIFQSIGAENWDSWDPVNTMDPFVTAGPFIVTYWEKGDYVELTYNQNFCYAIDHTPSPSVEEVEDFSFSAGTSGNTILWVTYSMYPSSYEVYRDNVIIEGGPWEGENIEINLDELTIGIHNITLILYDLYGSFAKDTVIINVIPPPHPTVEEVEDFSFSAGTSGNTILWVTYSMYPSSYEVYRDNVIIEGGPWEGENIEINLDELTIGIHNITLILCDLYGSFANDTVMVNVIDSTSPIVVGPSSVSIIEGTLGNSIEIKMMDENPNSYELYFDNNLQIAGPWNSTSENITISLDGLIAGSYEYRLVAIDGGTNIVNWIILVNVWDILPPSVSHPSDLVFYEGVSGNLITWMGHDFHPHMYLMSINGELVKAGLWNSTSELFTLNVDDLTANVYNITLLLSDNSMNIVYDTVIVTVISLEPTATHTTPSTTRTTTTTTTPTIPTTTTTTAVSGSFPSIFLIIVSFATLELGIRRYKKN